jgi:hypothetical protein
MLKVDALRGFVIPIFSINFTEAIQHLLTHRELLDIDTNRLFTSLTAMAKKVLSYS